jgi:hypothetical protein
MDALFIVNIFVIIFSLIGIIFQVIWFSLFNKFPALHKYPGDIYTGLSIAELILAF